MMVFSRVMWTCFLATICLLKLTLSNPVPFYDDAANELDFNGHSKQGWNPSDPKLIGDTDIEEEEVSDEEFGGSSKFDEGEEEDEGNEESDVDEYIPGDEEEISGKEAGEEFNGKDEDEQHSEEEEDTDEDGKDLNHEEEDIDEDEKDLHHEEEKVSKEEVDDFVKSVEDKVIYEEAGEPVGDFDSHEVEKPGYIRYVYNKVKHFLKSIGK